MIWQQKKRAGLHLRADHPQRRGSAGSGRKRRTGAEWKRRSAFGKKGHRCDPFPWRCGRGYDLICENGLNLADATCPFVKKIHRIVRREGENGREIVIIGNANHPEVEGIRGWCVSKVTVIGTEEEAEEFEPNSDTGSLCCVSDDI